MSKPNPLPDFGVQHSTRGPVGPLQARLIMGEIDEAEFERLWANMPWWRKIWETGAEAFFWTSALLAVIVWRLTS